MHMGAYLEYNYIHLYGSSYIDLLKFSMWVLTREWAFVWDAMVISTPQFPDERHCTSGKESLVLMVPIED